MRFPSTLIKRCALLMMFTATPAIAGQTPAAGQVDIKWTKYDVPHITAADYRSLGFGYGYVLASDRLCELAGRALTFRGERSRWYGADGTITVGFLRTTNLTSDLVYRTQLPDAVVDAALSELKPDTKEYLSGFVAGINHYVAQTPVQDRKAPCSTAHIPVFREADIARSLMSLGVIYRAIEFGSDVISSGTAWTNGQQARLDSNDTSTPVSVESGFGSNAWAYGGNVVKDNGTLFFAGPHSNWVQMENQLRLLLHQVHLTIPGKLDVAGASFWSFPLPMVGFNKDVTWTILDAAQSVTPFVRQVVTIDNGPAGPGYMMDGVRKPLEIRTISVDTLEPDNSVRTRMFDFAFSEMGPLYKLSAKPDRPAGWYAYTDSNEGNARGFDEFLAIARATSAAGFIKAVENNRGIVSHLMAGDKNGNVAFTESVQVLGATDRQLRRCHIGGTAPFNTLDGSRKACTFREAGGKPMLASASRYPRIISRGIIHNLNTSYMQTEYGKRQKRLTRLYGNYDVPEYNARQLMSSRRMHEISVDGVVIPDEAKQVVFDNRNFAAERWLDEILPLCNGASSQDVRTGCGVLKAWDRKNNADSRGALLFHQLWNRIVAMKSVIPKQNPIDPLASPSLTIAPAMEPVVAEAIGETVRELQAFGFSADARWGEALHADTKNGRIALHGGSYQEGILNGEQPAQLAKGGFPYILFGTAYAQFVRWEGGKVVAEVLLTHGQTGAESEGRTEQLKMFANKELYRLPFLPSELAEAEIVRTLTLHPGSPDDR